MPLHSSAHSLPLPSRLTRFLPVVLMLAFSLSGLVHGADAPAPPAPKPTPKPAPAPTQVRIKARLLEWTHDDTLDWGFRAQYGTKSHNPFLRAAQMNFPSQSAALRQGANIFLKGQGNTGPESSGVFNIDALIQLLEQTGDVKVRCQPNIVVSCPPAGAKPAPLPDPKAAAAKPAGKNVAKVSTDSEVSYEVVKAVGSTLVQVTEHLKMSTQLAVRVQAVEQDQFIRMHIDTSITDLGGYVSVGTNRTGDALMVPQTETRSINNTVLVSDRQMFIVGVLKTTIDKRNSQGVPWLARVPLLGYFFKNQQIKSKDQELLFVIQPEIIRD